MDDHAADIKSAAGRSWHLYRRTVRRYSRGLYHKADGGPSVHLMTGLKSLIFESIKIIYGSARLLVRRAGGGMEDICAFSTGNQARALGRARQLGFINEELRYIYCIDLRLNVSLLFSYCSALFIYPIYFSMAHPMRRRLLHERLLHSGRMRSIEAFLERRRLRTLAISNDHQGTVFVLATLASWDDVSVYYVQHGAVQPSFPRNDFHTLYLWDDRSVEIYRKISINPAVRLLKCPELIGEGLPQSDEKGQFGILIALSHPFPVFALVKASWGVRRWDLPVSLRFHPSDRLAFFKAALLWLINPRCRWDRSLTPFREAYRRCQVAMLASSSILIDAAEIDPDRVIWIRPFGLHWDYYKLEGRIRVANDIHSALTHVENILVASSKEAEKLSKTELK